MDNTGIHFVNVQENIPTTQSEVLIEDPFAGVSIEEEKPMFYRIEDKIFAEPLCTPNKNIININSDSNGEVTYYNQFAVSQFPGRRNKKYNLNIQKDDLTCPQERCCKTFSKTPLLRAHIRRVHCEKTTRFECHLCAAGFAEKYLLKRHLLVHSGDRRQCPVCSKDISVRTGLSGHLKSHQEGRFQCDLCSKKLKTRKSVVDHLRYVHRAGHLVCGQCGLKFTKTTEYRRHRAAHLERKIACEICGKLMATLTALGVHKRIHKADQMQEIYNVHKESA